jgi:anti-sigma B factor antagonist
LIHDKATAADNVINSHCCNIGSHWGAYTSIVMQQETITVEVAAGKTEGTRIVRVNGPLVLPNFFALKAELSRENTPVTILDLSGVPYMDSAGMGAIINYYVAAQRRGNKLIAAGTNERVIELFKLTHVDALIPMTSTVEEAEAL